MAYATFGGKWDMAANAIVNEATHFNTPGDGIQDEFEARWATLLDGVVSGMVCTTSTNLVAIASGSAIVAGKRYTGSGSVSFVGSSSGDYYVYIDSADDTTPYKKKTTAPGSGELTLCTCTWNGTIFTTPYLDDTRKVMGVLPCDLYAYIDGTLTLGKRILLPIPRDMWVEAVQIQCADTGTTSGGVTVDVSNGTSGSAPTTIFTTQARRPALLTSTADYTIASSGEPDGDRSVDAGEYLEVCIDAIDGGGTASTLTCLIKGRLR
jgi:hypothetical protein